MLVFDWNILVIEKDVDFEMSFLVLLGDCFESEMGMFGVFVVVFYENEWEVV